MILVKMNIPLSNDFLFLIVTHKVYKFGPSDSDRTHNQDDVYFTIMCHDAFGSVITDNIDYFQGFSDFTFKNL